MDPICLLPALGDGAFFCNSDDLPPDAQNLQAEVLSSTRSNFVARLPGSRAGVCSTDTYPAAGGGNIELSGFASCLDERKPQGDCERCLLGGSEMIKTSCPGKAGARAGSDVCCIRYEQYSFC
ncbi:unnamed protein product [Linum trigynum]|uniref:Gnk2-homologous domain-containing protein n=1 Tax=Linum trigynum TaxID=586398 RepID=A0AAV2GGX2_9ROSI